MVNVLGNSENLRPQVTGDTASRNSVICNSLAGIVRDCTGNAKDRVILGKTFVEGCNSGVSLYKLRFTTSCKTFILPRTNLKTAPFQFRNLWTSTPRCDPSVKIRRGQRKIIHLPVVIQAHSQLSHICKTHMKIETFAGLEVDLGTSTLKKTMTSCKVHFQCKFLSSFSGTKFTAEVWLLNYTMNPLQRSNGRKIRKFWLPTGIP